MPNYGMANRLRLCSEPAEIARAVTMMYQIEVTTHCNFECFYCAGRAMPQRHMPWDLFKSIIDGIPPGQHMVSLQGEGEPTTHPKFREMAEAVSARSLIPFTITNGAQIDADWMALTFPRIGVSIDTLDAAEAERIGRHKPDRVLKNLEALDARMGPKRIRIMSVNYGQSLDAVREFARARGYRIACSRYRPNPTTRIVIRGRLIRRCRGIRTIAATSNALLNVITTSKAANIPAASSKMRVCTSRSASCREKWRPVKFRRLVRVATRCSPQVACLYRGWPRSRGPLRTSPALETPCPN